MWLGPAHSPQRRIIEPRSTTSPAASPSPRSDECVTGSTDVSQLRFTTNDGIELYGARLGTGKIGVILAHQINNDLCAWLPFGRYLAAKGFTVLAFDFQGYGASDPTQAGIGDTDVAATAAERRSLGIQRIALIGVSAGGTALLVAASRIRPPVEAVVSLSGPAGFEQLDATEAVHRSTVPVLFVVAREDRSFAADARSMSRAARSQAKGLHILPGYEHGVALVTGKGSTEARTLLVGFLRSYVGGGIA
jgi:pimeloyl-ACP methyl ester carboxylesterase